MTAEHFERLLDKTAEQLGNDVRANQAYHDPAAFELRVREVLEAVAAGEAIDINPTFHAHAFPDIRANGFGVEVKTTSKDSWQSVGNSVFEGMRDEAVKSIYVIFGKMGGMPSVKWGRYEDRITHVRISHAPRFVLEMDRESSLFKKIGISYDAFAALRPEEKMSHIRNYSRSRLKPGERLWWLEDENSPGLPVAMRLYTKLPKAETVKLRAEATILFPQVVGGGRVKGKYAEASFFLLKHRNIFCTNIRDLFTAGSVAGKERGGNYLARSLKHIGMQLREAAEQLSSDLIEEYWHETVPPENRMSEWLKRADSFALGWKPSDELFKSGKSTG